jgi:hypothetical protein
LHVSELTDRKKPVIANSEPFFLSFFFLYTETNTVVDNFDRYFSVFFLFFYAMSDQANNVGGSSPGNSRRQYWCHQCEDNIEPLMAPHPTCPICNGDFVEEVD